MGNEPHYFVSGFDRISTLPKSTNALLSNGPSILSSRKLISDKNRYIDINYPKHFMTDSGGKQIIDITYSTSKRYKGFISDPEKPVHYEGYFNWSPEHWKRSILKDVPDFAISLDYPVPFNKSMSNYADIFKKANNINVSWARESLKIRKGYFPQTKIFVPFQGYTFRHLEQFMDDISGNDFDGLCLPMRCYADTKRFISFIKHIMKIGIKSLHLLGTSRLDVIAIVNYLCFHKYFKFISYDSCTVGLSARSDKILLPFDLRPIKIYERADEIGEILENGSLNSDHITVREFRDVQILEKKNRRRWLTDYNYDNLMRTKSELYQHSKSINSIAKYLSERSIRQDAIESIQNSLHEFERN